MDKLIIYLLHIILNTAIFYGIFYLLFKNEKKILLNRAYLMISSILSIILPLFRLPDSSSVVTYNIPTINLQPIVIQSLDQTHKNLSFLTDFLLIFLILVSAFLLIKTTINITKIFKSSYTKRQKIYNGIKYYEVDNNHSPFSYFNLIFIPSHSYNEEDLKKILLHENKHVSSWHSIDRLWFRLLNCIFWFNPFFWFYHKSIKNVHEFEADNAVIKHGYSLKKYQELLLNTIFSQIILANTNHFIQSSLKKRFIMLQSKTNKLSISKYLLAIPFALLFAITISCNAKEKQKAIIDSEATSEIKTQKDANITADTSVFQVVEELPSFPGGTAELMNYLASNINYPEEARINGVQGTVYISYIVESDGSISNVKILRGVSSSLDEEAIRVVESMPNWIPGKQNGENVRVQFNLPISFRLGSKK